MWRMSCPYCSGAQGRCVSTPWGRSVTECSSCGRVVEERQSQPHDLFLLRAVDSPLSLVTPDLFLGPQAHQKAQGIATVKEEEEEEDPFEPTGFITAFSTWSLEHTPIFASSSLSFSGHLAELERSLLDSSSQNPNPNSSPAPAPGTGPVVVVDNLRAYLQIVDVASILGVDRDISDHAFQLFRNCSSTTCLRNRSVEALATAALVQAIREAQEPRTLQEISTAANLPQKEIGKYIKILGEALQLSQPINSNSISVHMPRFCTLLQLNKSAQELATHIGEVVINKCFCTRRNPISISAAAIYLACQLEDKRKTQAEICKVTGLTEVTLRKVYKELLENWDDLLPPNYTPAVPPEKAFPMTTIASGRSSNPRVDTTEIPSSSAVQQDKEKQPEVMKPCKMAEVSEMESQARGKEEVNRKSNSRGPPLVPYGVANMDHQVLNRGAYRLPQHQHMFGFPPFRPEGEKIQKHDGGIDINETLSETMDFNQRVEIDPKSSAAQKVSQFSGSSSSNERQNPWPFHHRGMLASGPSHVRFMQPQMASGSGLQGIWYPNRAEKADLSRETDGS
ncbi:plant-specific TFIIB-related protein 1 [Magnolia sinica]|uniref:plant-specific TFIIB-related protein 1 n=1 Tax=Magnolia sinica TaxID=86752 RepID=UPI002659E323|nr:plant-specific TFIIB-related protein 1 [Magnolia sinica]